jgi:hypothetical protein
VQARPFLDDRSSLAASVLSYTGARNRSDVERANVPNMPGLGLPAYARRRLLELGRVVPIPAGWSPVHGAEPADRAYLVLEGRLCVMCGGTEVTLLGPGSFAGDLGLVDHRLRNARVVAVEPVRALTWSGSEFAQLREELPALERCCTGDAGHEAAALRRPPATGVGPAAHEPVTPQLVAAGSQPTTGP